MPGNGLVVMAGLGSYGAVIDNFMCRGDGGGAGTLALGVCLLPSRVHVTYIFLIYCCAFIYSCKMTISSFTLAVL